MAKAETPVNPDSLFIEGQWETVYAGARIKAVFEEFGDYFIGILEGQEWIEDPNSDNSWLQFNFLGVGPEEIQGQPCAVTPGYELAKTLEKVPVGNLTRITYVRDVEMADAKKNAMRSFRVDTRPATDELRRQLGV